MLLWNSDGNSHVLIVHGFCGSGWLVCHASCLSAMPVACDLVQAISYVSMFLGCNANEACPPGQYMPELGASECWICDEGTFTGQTLSLHRLHAVGATSANEH